MIQIKIAFRNLFKYFKNNILIAAIIIFSIMLSVLFSFFYKGLTVNLLGKIREIITGDYYITTPLESDHPDIFSRNFNFFNVSEKITIMTCFHHFICIRICRLIDILIWRSELVLLKR